MPAQAANGIVKPQYYAYSWFEGGSKCHAGQAAHLWSRPTYVPCAQSALPAACTAERVGSVDAQSGTTTGEVVGSAPAEATGRLEMAQKSTTLAGRIPDPSVPRARLVLKLYGQASGGTVIHTQEEFIVRGRLVNTASWSWQQLTVGKLATVDCWD